MKFKSILLLTVVVIIQMVILPWIMIEYNDDLGLPTFKIYILQFFGILLVIISLFIIGYCMRIFRVVGKGTPVPIEPAKEFVTSGLYKYLRNPMYVSYVIMYLGLFFISGSWLLFFFTLLLLIPFINLVVIFIEEPELEKRFGDTYLGYKKKVKRWGLI
jgi:protein-S-isoprenylcysteine O-methyltransferase Ste14